MPSWRAGVWQLIRAAFTVREHPLTVLDVLAPDEPPVPVDEGAAAPRRAPDRGRRGSGA